MNATTTYTTVREGHLSRDDAHATEAMLRAEGVQVSLDALDWYEGDVRCVDYRVYAKVVDARHGNVILRRITSPVTSAKEAKKIVREIKAETKAKAAAMRSRVAAERSC